MKRGWFYRAEEGMWIRVYGDADEACVEEIQIGVFACYYNPEGRCARKPFAHTMNPDGLLLAMTACDQRAKEAGWDI